MRTGTITTGRFGASTSTEAHLPGKHDQSSHGRGKGGVRRGLANAKTTDEVSAAASAEAKRITGRDITFDMSGSDLQVAKEHSEGILRGLEKYPHAELSEVRTVHLSDDVYAHNRLAAGPTHHYRGYDRQTDIIEFNSTYAGNPTNYHNSLKSSADTNWHPKSVSTPMGTALHEFGHTMAHHSNAAGSAGRHAKVAAQAASVPTSDYVARHVSRYATTNERELAAEAFASVMVGGASPLSRAIGDLIDGAYSRNNAHLPQGPLPTAVLSASTENRTYRRDQQGRFAGHGGVRQSLQDAATTEQVAQVLKSEVSSILGHEVKVGLAGLDVDVARVHAEGVLRGAEAFPTAQLRAVNTYGPDSPLGHHGGMPEDAYAVTKRGEDIWFNTDYGDIAHFSEEMDRADHLAGTHGDLTRVGSHEFGHVVNGTVPHANSAALRVAKQAAGTGSRSGLVRREVSTYATKNSSELFAEAFMDVVSKGDGASDLSKAIVSAATAGPSNRAVRVRNEVDLSGLQAEFERQLDALLRRWTDITADQRAQIVDQVRAAVTSNDLAALARLHVSTSEAAQVLTEAMADMALEAAREVVAEAEDQGIRLDPVASDTAPFAATAAAITALLAEALTNSGGREAVRRWSPSTSGDEVSAAVDEHLASLSDSFVRDNLSGAMMSALTTGRMNTMLAGPSAAIYGSEYMDRNTCKPCRRINGKWIGNSDDPDITAKVEAVYPNGGYKNCLGGVRCRGTVVAVWRPEQTEGPGVSVTVR